MKPTKQTRLIKQNYLAFGMLLTAAIFSSSFVFGQDNKETAKSISSSTGDDTFTKMIEYSRPNKFHQLLGDLVGSWKFTGSHFNWIDSVTSEVEVKLSGTAIRKPFANGRFFIVELTTDGKIPLPIQNGKMIEGLGKGIQTEGYDNVKNKYQVSYINNHIGSAIWNFEGSYDSTSRTITFDGEIEFVPGMKMKNRFLFIFIDKDHYKWELDEEAYGKYRKASEMNFTRVN